MSTRTELELRVADAMAMAEAVETDDDGNMKDPDQFGAFMSALDHALRGDPGCNERNDWQADRLLAHEKYEHLL